VRGELRRTTHALQAHQPKHTSPAITLLFVLFCSFPFSLRGSQTQNVWGWCQTRRSAVCNQGKNIQKKNMYIIPPTARGGVRREARVRDVPSPHAAARCSFLSLNGALASESAIRLASSSAHHRVSVFITHTHTHTHTHKLSPLRTHARLRFPPTPSGAAQSAQIISRGSDG
jgi:hypothetical protein